ncbi:hypothetical protein IG631_23049 [Alternaria alternata]|nr:hypothetical protein IG631_23049 [Alternaria alternata]
MSSDSRESSPRAMLQGTRAVDRGGQRGWSGCASDGRHGIVIFVNIADYTSFLRSAVISMVNSTTSWSSSELVEMYQIQITFSWVSRQDPATFFCADSV